MAKKKTQEQKEKDALVKRINRKLLKRNLKLRILSGKTGIIEKYADVWMPVETNVNLYVVAEREGQLSKLQAVYRDAATAEFKKTKVVKAGR